MKRSINFRFLGCVVGVAAFLAVGGHFLHGFQVRRNAGDLKDRADRARDKAREAESFTEASQKYAEAIQQYRRYLQLVPDDGSAKADYGLSLAHRARAAPQYV